MIEFITTLKMAQLHDWLFVGPEDIPVSANLIEKLKKITALGLDISAKENAVALATFLDNPFTLDSIKEIPDADWGSIYNHVMGTGGDVSQKPKQPLGPEPEVEPEPTEQDVSGLPETYTMEQLQKMRGGMLYSTKMKYLAAPPKGLAPGTVMPMADMKHLLDLITEAGFNVRDRVKLIQLLQFFPLSKSPFTGTAQALSNLVSKMDDKQYMGLLKGPDPVDQPSPKAPGAKTPVEQEVPREVIAPPQPKAVEPPPTPDAPAVPPVQAPTAPASLPAVKLQKKNKTQAKYELVDRYDEISSMLPEGVTKAKLGADLGVNAWTEGGKRDNKVYSVTAGSFVHNRERKKEGMVIGKSGTNLFVATTDGSIEEWNPAENELRRSQNLPPRREDY